MEEGEEGGTAGRRQTRRRGGRRKGEGAEEVGKGGAPGKRESLGAGEGDT